MPSIIIKDEYGTPETYLNVNTVKFETPDGGYASFRYNEGLNYPVNTGGYRVRFIDYDGTVLNVVYVDEGDSVSFPLDPTHEGLLFTGWGRTTEELSSITSDMDVGAFYSVDPEALDPADEVTRITIDTSLSSSTSVVLYWAWEGSIGSRKLNIDWGDGSSATQSTSTSASHSYAEAGIYEIQITVINPVGGIEYVLQCTNSASIQLGRAVTAVTLGNNVNLGDYAFYSCSSLHSISMPEGITSIGGAAFSYCESLRNVIVPGSVTTLDSAFQYCYNLQSVSLPESVTSMSGYIFRNCYKLHHINLPRQISSIGDYAFSYCISLESIVIPPSVTSIGSYAFQYCHSLRNVIMSEGVNAISWNAFHYCSSLDSIVIPEGVTTIQSATFQNCCSLRSIVLPSTVTSFNSTPFYDCKGMQRFVINAITPPTTSSLSFGVNVNSTVILVPTGCADAYKSASGWSNMKNYIQEST